MIRPKPVRILLKAAARAREQGNWAALVAAGDGLEREQCFPEAWACLADGGAIKARAAGRVSGPEWDRSAPAGRRICVVRLLRHTGAQLRMARVVAQLADAGAEVTLCVEPRLQPLFARSFPTLRIIDETHTQQAMAACDCWASYERVAQVFWDSPQAIAGSFRPLVPDAGLVETLKARYGGPGRSPVIGISWFSTNTAKDVPDAADWAALLAEQEGAIVSLQYGPEEAGLGALQRAAGRPIVNDPAIDSLADLDAFAAQIMAVDTVLTISNTAAHMAGALGKRTLVFLDDKDHLIWPRGLAGTCFYPKMHLVRRAGRPWPEAMQEALRTAPP